MNKSKGKKGNGHKANCMCPICKNMRKGKGGAVVPPSSTETNTANVPEADVEVEVDADAPIVRQTANDNRLESMTATPDELAELSSSSGGRKRKTMKKSMKKRGNGHKSNCMCPICKNMRKGKGKTRRR